MAAEMARLGVTVEKVAVSASGRLDFARLERLLALHPGAVVAVQLANSETGVVQDVAEVARVTKAAGAALHCDAVQAAGKIVVRAAAWGVDTLAVAGHKLGSPPGVGALVVREGRELAPLIPGAQEGHRRGGTENLPGIAAMGVAARLAVEELSRWTGVSGTRDGLEAAVLARLAGSSIYGAGEPRLPNTSCIGLPPGLRGGAAVAALDLAGFAVSSGPACSSGVERPSPAIAAMGFGVEEAERTLRVSLGPGTGAGDVVRLVAALEARLDPRRWGCGMIVSCPSCKTKYQFDEARFGEAAVEAAQVHPVRDRVRDHRGRHW